MLEKIPYEEDENALGKALGPYCDALLQEDIINFCSEIDQNVHK